MRVRSMMVCAGLPLLLASPGGSQGTSPVHASTIAATSLAEGGSPYLLILAGDKDGAEEDFLAVIDVRAGSPTIGKATATLPIGHRRSMPHHMEYELPRQGQPVFANAHHPEETLLVDVSNPLAINIRKRVRPPAPLRFQHDYARLPNGNVLTGFLRSDVPGHDAHDKASPGHGGIAEYDEQGNLLRSASAALAAFKVPVRLYAILPMLDIDRIVTTSARMMETNSADVIQVWRYSDLQLLHTLAVPPGKRPDGSPLPWGAMMPFGPRRMADGSVLMNTYMCAFYRLTDIASPAPQVAHVYDIHGRDPAKEGTRVGCSVPVVVGKYWIMPVGSSQSVFVLDVSNPAAPREVSRLAMPADFDAHWAAEDPLSDRIAIGAELEKEKGIFIIRFDEANGQLRFDERFSSAGRAGYIDLDNQRWPHGDSGPAWGHAALFLPSAIPNP